MRWRTLFLAMLVVLASAVNPGPAELEPLVGDYLLTGRTDVTKQRDESIDVVVGQMNALVRGIARSRLREGNPIPTRLSIQQAESRMTVNFDGAPQTAVVDGDPITTKSRSGDPLKMTFQQRGTTLVQRFVGKNGGRENIFRAHGDRLTVDVRVFSRRLPEDVVFQLKFERQ